VLGALGLSGDLNAYFQLVPMETPAARATLAAVIIADGVICFGVDKLLKVFIR
jgi:hypothetical protein